MDLRLAQLRRIVRLLTVLLVVFGGWTGAQEDRPTVLAQVYLSGPPDRLELPVHAHLSDTAGQEYVLTVAPASELRQRAASYRILDETGALKQEEWYLLARERRRGAREQAETSVTVLLDDGRRILARATPAQAEQLADWGFDLAWLSARPLVLRAPEKFAEKALTPLPLVQGLINQVTQSTVVDYTSRLSGVLPAAIGGSAYTIATRHTRSGTPIEKATQYVYERMQALGLAVSYHSWSMYGTSGRNVIGERPGTLRPAEIVVIAAHLDNMPSGALAPGADDNASGATGVLIAAELLCSQQFERTLQFVFFTGEEQGLLGSAAYAGTLYAAGKNIVAVHNLDMIAWDEVGGPVLRLYTRLPSNPGYPGDLAIAQLFADVVSNYGLSSSLTPIIQADGENASDHASFWDYGYAAILTIEDDYDDYNAYYHTENDTLDRLDLPYFTAMVKASVGVAAHLAIPTAQTGNSYLLWTK